MIINDKYFKEKAREWVSTHGLEEKYLQSLEIAFKEVSKDTRHACAEAVLQGDYSDCHTGGDIATRVHALCMNAVR
jgi:hypothetical protein